MLFIAQEQPFVSSKHTERERESARGGEEMNNGREMIGNLQWWLSASTANSLSGSHFRQIHQG